MTTTILSSILAFFISDIAVELLAGLMENGLALTERLTNKGFLLLQHLI